MQPNEVLADLFGRIDEHVHAAVDGLDAATLAMPPANGTNPIGWLVWHATRVADHHLAELVHGTQVWLSDGWAARFGVPADPDNTGYGHTPADVAAIKPDSAEALIGYHEAVAGQVAAFLAGTTAADLDRIVDRRWDPPVTLGVRLVSMADDAVQHAGQAAYARGIIERNAQS